MHLHERAAQIEQAGRLPLPSREYANVADYDDATHILIRLGLQPSGRYLYMADLDSHHAGQNAARALADFHHRGRPAQLQPVPAAPLPGSHGCPLTRRPRLADPLADQPTDERRRADGPGRRHRPRATRGGPEDRRIGFDWLVLAIGARHSYFGMDEWEATAPGLKKIADATGIRERVLLAFERAEITSDPEERRQLLTFVVIGGGPTGVEMAGAVAELANHALAADFRAIDPMAARVILVEGGSRVVAAFPPDLSERARRQLERLRVEARLGRPVQRCDETGVTVGEDHIGARTVIWAAGVIASPAARWLGARHDRAGRILVAPDLRVPDWDEVFAIGDTVSVGDANGRPVPGIAPAAKQMGAHVGRMIDASIRGRALPPPFRYVHHGSLATIGRRAAVAGLGGVRLSGFPAWALWAVAHVWFLIGWRNRVVVALNWLWSYVTFQRGARLITSGEEQMAAMSSDLEQRRPTPKAALA